MSKHTGSHLAQSQEQKKATYPWKRFWCPREGEYSLADEGFLVDPESEDGRYYNRDVVPFENLAQTHCLILLGEAGIGKSQTMQAERANLDRLAATTGGRTLWLNLNSVGSEERLQRKLFNSSEFNDWAKGQHALHLFLDSLDECLMRIDTLSALIVDELKNRPTKRMYLRIACRTALWPQSLEQGLREHWPEETKAYELMPIRRRDVELAVQKEGVEPSKFLRQVTERLVVPFATRPITLAMLIPQFKMHGSLPATQKDIYLQGCELLCTEPDEARSESRNPELAGRLDPEQRLAIAARIAAVTAFSNRSVVWKGVGTGEVGTEEVRVDGLCGGCETSRIGSFVVDAPAIREVLDTGLFSSRGQERMGWAHKTYQDFLAAHFLAEHKVTMPQLRSLLTLPNENEVRVIPQLSEVAAWSSVMNPSVYRLLSERDPGSLLDSDVNLADDEQRADLTGIALQMCDEKRTLGWGRSRYRKLQYHGLDSQLRPVITNRNQNVDVRRMAVEIAEACRLTSLGADLAHIALNENEQYGLRCNAAHAVYQMGDIEAKASLKPLMADGAADFDDSLKGYALAANWPDRITPEELFPLLSHPGHKWTVYTGFIHHFASQLPPSGLPAALDWVAQHHANADHHDVFSPAVDEIMLRGFQNLDSPGVLDALVRAIVARLVECYPLVSHAPDTKLGSAIDEDDDKRRRLLCGLFPALENLPAERKTVLRGFFAYARGREVGVCLLCDAQPRLFLPEKDTEWLVREYEASDNPQLRQFMLHLLSDSLRARVREFTSSELADILRVSQADNCFAKELAWLLDPVRLDSEEAKSASALYRRLRTPPKESTANEEDNGRLRHLELHLRQFESGKTDAWVEVCYAATGWGISIDSEWESDIMSIFNQSGDPEGLKARVTRAARAYLDAGSPQSVLGPDDREYYWSAGAGVGALLLIRRLDPDLLNGMPQDLWRKWAGAVLAFAVMDGESLAALVILCYSHAPDEVLEMLPKLIDREDRSGDRLWLVMRCIHDCWDERISRAIRNRVRKGGLKPTNARTLLAELIARDDSETCQYAEKLLGGDIPSDPVSRETAVALAAQLACSTQDADWSVVWHAIAQDKDLGHQILLEIAEREDIRDFSVNRKLTENQLADLFIWSVRNGRVQMGRRDGHTGGAVTDEVKLGMWLEGIPNHLAYRGSSAACLALRRCKRAIPKVNWTRLLLTAEENRLRNAWLPLDPSDLLKLSRDPNRRMINDETQLLDSVMEALKRIHRKMQASTAGFGPVWNTKVAKRPKDENEISDDLKDRISDDLGPNSGVIVNREVQIRRGQRTDIHVDCTAKQPQSGQMERLSVVVEVKGCWHRELYDAVETQLVDKYLVGSGHKHGLYLVIWASPDAWDDIADGRRNIASKRPKDVIDSSLQKKVRQLNKKRNIHIEYVIFDISLQAKERRKSKRASR